jgi:hypothetical protein
MKLTLERDNGEQLTIAVGPETPDRLEMMQGLCKLLDSWATEQDKDKEAL